jgi:large subunit ribosomal protein L25
LYGQKENVSFTVNPIELNRIIEKTGQNTLIDLIINGDSVPKRTALLKDMDMHPYRDQWLHADFYEINPNEQLKVQIPIRLVGHSPAEKLGALVEHHHHELEVKCLPGNIPESIEVQMAEVQMDQVVHVSDLKIPEGLEVLDEPETAVVAVHIVKVKEEKAEGEGEGEEAAEGEGEKKAEG